jgi:hypothetical protein
MAETTPGPDFSQPFYKYDQEGNVVGGYATSVPALTPGSPDNALFMDSSALTSNPVVAGAFIKIEKDFIRKEMKPGYLETPEGRSMQPFSPLVQAFPNAKEAKRSVSMAVLESDHNAEHVLAAIGDDLRSLVETRRDEAGDYTFRADREMSDEQIIGLAEARGVDPGVIEYMRKSKDNALSRYGVDTMQTIRSRMVRFDRKYETGKYIAEDIQHRLFGLEDNHIKAQAFRDYSYYKGNQISNHIPQFAQALGHLGASFFESVVKDLPQGVLEVATGPLDDAQSLSADFRTDPARRTRAMAVLERAERLGRSGLYDHISANRDQPEKVIAKAGEFVRNPEVQQVMIDLQQLKDEGAFVPAGRASRLYSFFDGGVKASQEFYRMLTASPDPSAFLFNLEAMMGENDDKVLKQLEASGVSFPALHAAIIHTAQGSKRYHLMKDGEILNMVRQLQENHEDAFMNSDRGGVERMYMALAESTQDPNMKSIWMDAARAAGELTNLGVVDRSQTVLDPTVVVGVGAAKLVGAVAKGAKVAAFIDSALVARAEALGVELTAGIAAAEGADAVIAPAVKSLQDNLRIMGVVVSENEAIALALSQNAQSWEIRAAINMSSTEAKAIRDTVGKLAAKDKNLRGQLTSFLKDARDAAAKVPKPTAVAGKAVSGMVATGVGVSAEKSGIFIDNLADMILGQFGAGGVTAEGLGLVRGAKYLGAGTAVVTTIGGVYGLSEGGVEGMVNMAGRSLKYAGSTALFAVGGKIVGPVLQRHGRLLANVADEIATGERKGVSIFLQSADRLDEGAAALKAQKGDPKKIMQMMQDAQYMRALQKMGYEEALVNTVIVGKQGVAGTSFGAVLAWSNARDNAASGAGMGAGGAFIAGVAAKVGSMLPSGVSASREMGVMSTSLYYLNRASAEQKANFFEMFRREVGVGPDGKFINAAEAMRLMDAYNLLNASMGPAGFELINPGAMQGGMVGIAHANIDMDALKLVAGKMYPKDPAMAAAYAERLVERVNANNNTAVTIAAYNQRLDKNGKATERANVAIDKINEAIKRAEAANDQKRLAELKSELSSHEAKKEVFAKEKSKLEQERDLQTARLVDREAIVRRADQQQLTGKERETFIEAEVMREAALLNPIRPGEMRVGTAGQKLRQIADGYYVNDDTGKVFIDYTKAGALTMIHEGFEAILRDDAMKVVLPELVNFFYADPSSPTSTKRLLSDGNRQRFFDLYASDLTPENSAKYKADLASAEKLYKETGDSSALMPFVQEAAAWWLAVLHDSYPPGYSNVLGAAPGTGAQVRIFDKLFQQEKKGVFRKAGDMFTTLLNAETPSAREAAGVLASEFEAFLNPEYGWLAQKTRGVIRQRLESNGMIFEDASDGTVRGYFRQNGETINNPVMGDLYRVISRNLSGGKRSVGMDVFSNPRIPEGVKIEWIRQNGLDHLLTEPVNPGDSVKIKTPEEIRDTTVRITNSVRDSLGTVPTDQRGTTTTINPSNNQVIFHGVPSPAEIKVIRDNPDLPPVVRDNLVGVMEGLASGKSNAVLRAQYVNTGTTQKGVGTQARLNVPKDTGGSIVSEQEFIPLGLVFGMSDMLPGGVKVPGGAIPSVSVLTFGIGAAKRNLAVIRNKGVVTMDGLLKDAQGMDVTPERFRQMFPTDGDYWNAVNVYVTHLQAAGRIDPTNNRPTMPAGYEPSAVKLAALTGDVTNIKLGESMRNVIRASLGIDARKDLILLNPAGYGKVVRDINQTITSLRIDGLGKITATGETFSFDHNTLAWSQANMAPSTWIKLNEQGLAALRATDGWDTKVALGHPNNNFRIVEDSRVVDGNTEKRIRIYDASTGNLIEHNAKDIKGAREFVRDKMATDAANAEVAAAVAEMARTEVERQIIPGSTDVRSAHAFSKTIKPSDRVTEAFSMTQERLSRPIPLFRGVSADRLSVSTNAQFGAGYYYTPMFGAAEKFALERGKGAGIEHGMVDLSQKRLLNLAEIDRSSPQFQALVQDLGLGTNASASQILNAVRSKYPQKNTMFQSAELGNIAKKAGYDGIISDVAGDAGGDSYSQVMLFDPAMAPREKTVKTGLAERELTAYTKSKADKIAAAARRIIKEQKIEFTRNQNETVDVQRKWEEQAARLAADEREAAATAASKQEAQRRKDATDAEARSRELQDELGREFAAKANEYSAAERFYFGDKIKLNSAIAELDRTPKGLVDLERSLSTSLADLGVEVRTQGVVQALPLPIYRKAMVFQKRPLSQVPTDLARVRSEMMGMAEATTLQTARGMMQEANNYVLTNALGQIIVSEMRSRQGMSAQRYFSVYAAGTKAKIMETTEYEKAIKAMLSEAYKADAKANPVKVPTEAERGMRNQIFRQSQAGEEFAPRIIQRYR